MAGAWETEAEWRRLKHELDAWREWRDRADQLGQHRSQLDAAYTLIDRVLAELRTSIAATAAHGPMAAAQCRVHDRRLAWVRRVWDFFRERFDQRDDAALGPVLRGADEVVWSCHREPYAALAVLAPGVDGPPPLPYVEPALTPEVFPHGLVPGALRRDVDAPFLRRALDQLPFAVVRVPASCVTAPWWLIHLGHEVGHVIDARLLGVQARTVLVEGLGLEARSTADWTHWSGETFADLYAVLMHGQWALWALAVAETGDEATMRVRRDSYPPPVVRLLVMAHACAAVGAATSDVADEIAAWQAVVDGDAVLAAMTVDGRRVVEALLGAQVNRTSWSMLTAWEAGQWGRKALGSWSSTLTRRPTMLTTKARRPMTRLLVAASVLRRKDGETAPGGLDGAAIAGDLLAWLPAVREPGSRATQAHVGAAVGAQAAALARDLMEAEPLP